MKNVTIYDLSRKDPATGKPGLPVSMPEIRAKNCLRYNSQQWVTKKELTAVAVHSGEISAEVIEAVQDVDPVQLKKALALLNQKEDQPKDELEYKSLSDLRRHAEELGIDISGLRSKKKIIAAIRK